METRPELPKQPHHHVQEELLSACSDASTSWRAPAYGPAFWAAQGADVAVPHAKCPLPLGCTTAAALPKSLQKKRLSLQESPPDLFIYHGLLSINTSCFKQKGTDGQLRSQPPAVLCGGEDAQTSFAPRAGKRQLPAVPSSATQTQGTRARGRTAAGTPTQPKTSLHPTAGKPKPCSHLAELPLGWDRRCKASIAALALHSSRCVHRHKARTATQHRQTAAGLVYLSASVCAGLCERFYLS